MTYDANTDVPIVPASKDHPYSAPDDVSSIDPATQLDDTHPATDNKLQPEEIYNEDLPGAAEAEEPNTNSAVVNYHPPGN